MKQTLLELGAFLAHILGRWLSTIILSDISFESTWLNVMNLAWNFRCIKLYKCCSKGFLAIANFKSEKFTNPRNCIIIC